MKKGDFILIDYVGRVKDTEEIFDLTKEEAAKKEKIYSEKFKYGPVPVIIDANFVLPGLNEALKEMKIGEKRNVEVAPEKGFGDRKNEYVKLLPESKFKDQDIDVTPGSIVTINNIRGRIISSDGGRVKIDFNHPLAGKILLYDVEIVSEITDINEKVKSVVWYFLGTDKENVILSLKEKCAEISFKEKIDVHEETKETIANTIMNWVDVIEEVVFSDKFKKRKE